MINNTKFVSDETKVRLNAAIKEFGEVVASFIKSRIKDKNREHEKVHLKPELVIRKSTAPLT